MNMLTPLHHASMKRKTQDFLKLIQFGARIDSVTRDTNF